MDRRRVWVNGPVIVGAGPTGLAVGSSLRARGVPFVILERAECIASLWQNRTYDRLRLHLPKSFCQLPNLPFPSSFPTYPSRKQFISYLESYCEKFSLNPNFNEPVISAEFNQTSGLWQVSTSKAEYLCRWLVAATGENSQPLIPEIEGLGDFPGEVIHACDYKSGESFSKKKVLVVGCGNSGMEISLDLAHHGASPLMVVRNSVHVLPREVLGWSTFELAMRMLTWLPLKLVDRILLVISWLAMGDLGKLGLRRPEKGPLETKRAAGKTPVLDVGAVEKIKAGEIAVVPGILTFCGSKVELEDGGEEEIDAVVLATGYRSNLPVWLKERELVGDGGFPRGWRGGLGFYAVGFSRSGLAGAALEAGMVAEEVDGLWREQTGQARRASFSL